jgi:hypothetical protein
MNTSPNLQLIADEPKLQISTIKTKYLASSYFSDTDKHISTFGSSQKVVISSSH